MAAWQPEFRQVPPANRSVFGCFSGYFDHAFAGRDGWFAGLHPGFSSKPDIAADVACTGEFNLLFKTAAIEEDRCH